jgi:hypothetical protein
MITLWEKDTKKIVNQTTDHSLEENYRLKAQGKQLNFHSNPNSNVFPDYGYQLNSAGDHVPMAPEKSVATLAVEEQVATGVISLDSVKQSHKHFLYLNSTVYLNSTKTENGYICSDAAQKICIATVAMKNISDNDEDKLRMTQDGLLYELSKAREILAKCAAVTASYRAACAAVDRAQNVAQVHAVKLETFL